MSEWTPQAVKAFIVEAAQTLKLMPESRGPKEYGNAMPDVVYDAWDVYGRRSAGYRLTASARALSTLDRVEAWINALPDEENRRLIRAWSIVKASPRQKIRAFANENGMTTDILRHRIDMICNQICEQLNRSRSILLNNPPLHLAEDEPKHGQSDVNGTIWAGEIAVHREPDAIPTDRSENSPDRLSLVERLSQAMPRHVPRDEPQRKGDHRAKRCGNRQQAQA